MTGVAVKATKGFLQDFQSFRRYSRGDVPAQLYKFLIHKIQVPGRFNQKDGTMAPAIPGYMHCHLLFGKVIVIYQRDHQSIRLYRIVEHNDVEHRGAVLMKKSLRKLNENSFCDWVMPMPPSLEGHQFLIPEAA